MTNVARMLMATIGAGMFAQAWVASLDATTLTHGSYQLESLESAPSSMGQLLFNSKISGMDKGPETLSISSSLTSCDLDPKGCTTTTPGGMGGRNGATTVASTEGSTGQTAGAMAEIPEPESLILLIIGLIGLSRLRGKPVK